MASARLTLTNSAGFWLILFCGFGLINIYFGQARLSERLTESDNKFRAHPMMAAGSETGDAPATSQGDEEVEDTDASAPGNSRGNRRGDNRGSWFRTNALLYGLLGCGVLFGIAILGYDLTRPTLPRSTISRPTQATSASPERPELR